MVKTFLTIALCSLTVINLAGCNMMHPTDPYAVAASNQIQEVGNSQVTAFKAAGSRTAISRTATSRTATSGTEVSRTEASSFYANKNRQITLKEAIGTAMKNNPKVAAARHEIKAAEARRVQAFAEVLPRIDANGGYIHDMDNQRLIQPHYNGEPGVFGDDIFSANIVLSQAIFTGGRITNEIKAAKLLRQAAGHQLARTRNELIFNISSVFYEILAQRQVIESIKFSRKTLNEHLKQINNLIAQKKAARVDRLRTEVRIADVVQQLTSARNILSIENRVLANLMGVSGEKKTFTPKGKLSLESEPGGNVNMMIKKAFQQRKDYMAARAVLNAEAKKLDAARAGHWPSISLQGAYGERWAQNPSEHPRGTDDSEDTGQIGILVNLPVFEGGKIDAKIHEERARLATLQDQLRTLELNIRLDVETARLNMDNAKKRINTTEKAIAQAKETLRIEKIKYNNGKGSITDVLDAQAAMLDSQTNYYRALADHNIALAQMNFATGEVE